MALRRGFQDHFDWPLFMTVAAIAVVGVINLYSASSAAGGGLRDVYIQQIYWLTLGAGAAVLVAAVDYRHFERYGWVAYGFGLVLLVLVFLLAREIRGSQRWIPIGSFSLQPSEASRCSPRRSRTRACSVAGPVSANGSDDSRCNVVDPSVHCQPRLPRGTRCGSARA